ncbi:(d)CMP kinase [Rubellimicrobium aerolatum]|uniref:Cytidylate kinase n=1 Tax=Rubellimicrobium aerolatum TaxID=490979 RepID=A0ABW0SG85_9RHOB|nr:(d)CMP kinase [Rubellimicrobium aerolatum]MBP1807324.1 cytidylate kinase [Rubellimicrobium aerolatum]
MVVLTVAIDGPAAAGKGTIAKALARELGLRHLDTGSLYRAVALRVLGGEDAVAVARGLGPDDLADPRLRQPEVAQEASRVAAIPEVRAALLDFQKAFARAEGGAVLDGRDIGTVVCPEAEVKLFVTASAEARAARRHAEQVAAGQESSLERTLAEIRARDARDEGRDHAPLRAAGDAVVIDTSGLGIDEAVARALGVARARLGR